MRGRSVAPQLVEVCILGFALGPGSSRSSDFRKDDFMRSEKTWLAGVDELLGKETRALTGMRGRMTGLNPLRWLHRRPLSLLSFEKMMQRIVAGRQFVSAASTH